VSADFANPRHSNANECGIGGWTAEEIQEGAGFRMTAKDDEDHRERFHIGTGIRTMYFLSEFGLLP
jgi:hypothetical protein